MKKSVLIVAFIIIPAFSFPDDDKKIVKEFLAHFKALPQEKQVAALANKHLVEGYLNQDTRVAAAFKTQPKYREKLNALAKELMPDIKEHCWNRLDSDIQDYLIKFARRPYEQRKDVIFSLNDKRLDIFLLPEEEVKLLQGLQDWQKEPFFVYVTVLEIEQKEELFQPSSPLMHKKESCSKRIPHLNKISSRSSLHKLFGVH